MTTTTDEKRERRQDARLPYTESSCCNRYTSKRVTNSILVEFLKLPSKIARLRVVQSTIFFIGNK